jgi:hypothetical protein
MDFAGYFASRQTYTQKTAKLTKKNNKNTNGNVQSVTTCKKRQQKKTAKQIPSGISK